MESFLKNITKKAGRAVLERFGKIGVKYTKADIADVVTEADLVANKIIIDAIKRKYPKHGIISEETGEYKASSEYVWIVDPLDGTRNFSTRTPLFAVMIALARRNRIEIASMYNPCSDELFFAKKDNGTYRNDKKVRCSDTKDWTHSWGIMPVKMAESKIKILGKILQHSKKESCWVSAFGSGGVNSMYVADGRRDWLVSLSGGVWDYAASYLLLKEAGCKVTNVEGRAWHLKDKTMIAANPRLHPKLLKIIHG